MKLFFKDQTSFISDEFSIDQVDGKPATIMIRGTGTVVLFFMDAERGIPRIPRNYFDRAHCYPSAPASRQVQTDDCSGCTHFGGNSLLRGDVMLLTPLVQPIKQGLRPADISRVFLCDFSQGAQSNQLLLCGVL